MSTFRRLFRAAVVLAAVALAGALGYQWAGGIYQPDLAFVLVALTGLAAGTALEE